MPRSPSTVRARHRLPATSRPGPVARSSGVSTEYTSVVAPPTSTTARSPPRVSASTSTPVSTASGVAARTNRANRAPRDSRLPPMTWRRNTARIAARADAGASTPMRGRTLSASVTGTPASRSSPVNCSRTSALPAYTTGRRHRARARRVALWVIVSASPPSVPPTSSTTSGRAARNAVRSAAPSRPAATCTTCAPADNPTRRPACAVTSGSYPITASRSPPPADEHTYQGTSRTPSPAVAAATAASRPCSTSVPTVVGADAAPARTPAARSTTATFVYVEPTSAQTARVTTRRGRPRCRSR
ncbi:Glycoprotein gp2 [Micromonospora noduli]|nr:Glycoprotein gp2 [Micromonospora noduli]